jgi:MoaA/NifB/PqqE/SkfB family radical SAM enzyme
LSGGEPTLHEDFSGYLRACAELGLKITVSTNGASLDDARASEMADLVSYVGISVDGPRDVHDSFRGKTGSFDASLRSARLLASLGCRVGLRVTMALPQTDHLDEIFRIAESLPLSRICFYHFMSSGRGALDASLAPGKLTEDAAFRRVIDWADEIGRRAAGTDALEVLTVGDSSDSVRVYEHMTSRSAGAPEGTLRLMSAASGRIGGTGILSVRWDGIVYQNQFLWDRPMGNWRDMALIAGTSDAGAAIAEECVSCLWRERKICSSRVGGFGGSCHVREHGSEI